MQQTAAGRSMISPYRIAESPRSKSAWTDICSPEAVPMHTDVWFTPRRRTNKTLPYGGRRGEYISSSVLPVWTSLWWTKPNGTGVKFYFDESDWFRLQNQRNEFESRKSSKATAWLPPTAPGSKCATRCTARLDVARFDFPEMARTRLQKGFTFRRARTARFG